METASAVAFLDRAPADERADAQAQLQKSHTPRGLSDVLIPPSDVQLVIDHIRSEIEEQEMVKAAGRSNVVPFPSKFKQQQSEGMRSLYLDDMQINIQGDYYDRPSSFGFDAMRKMVEHTPILNAVIMTRQRQVQRFCQISDETKPGFRIRLKDKDAHASSSQKQTIKQLQNFFLNCGWQSRPRDRMRLKRDSFASFMAKSVRDSLTLDSAPIETEFKRDRAKGMDGFYAIDGATIRLCTEEGYQGADEIFALQVVQGNIRTTYNYDQLIYLPRNPRSDIMVGGYGLAETELLVRVVTGFLNAFTYNTRYFDSNSIPRGMLHLTGNYSDQDLSAFKRMWNAMVKGINNTWALPVMVSKDQESKAAFENFGVEVSEMMFAKWMSFLASLICAIYGIAPDEINFESFSVGKSSLSGDDTEEKLANSRDKGLLPLLSYFSGMFSDFIVSEFSDEFEFEWTGLEQEDKKQKFEEVKLCNTVNELRASRGEDKIEDSWGDAPLNPTLITAWQASEQAKNDDFGDPMGGLIATDKPDSKQKKAGSDLKKSLDTEGADANSQEDADQTGDFGLPVFEVEV